MAEFRKKLNGLYNGTSKKSVRFRFGLIAFDTVTISFFIVTSMVELSVWIITIDFMGLRGIVWVDIGISG